MIGQDTHTKWISWTRRHHSSLHGFTYEVLFLTI